MAASASNCQVLRRLDADLHVHVAARGGTQHREALGAQPELVAGLGACRDGDAGAPAVDAGHLDMPAEGRLRHAQGHADEDVRTLALEDRVRAQRDVDIEVAGGRAAQAGLALAGQADAGAVLDAGRDGDVERALALHAPRPLADLAGVLDDAPGPAAGGAGALDQEEALLRADLSRALAARAGLRAGGGGTLGPGALARLAGDRGGDADIGLRTGEGFLEADLDLGAQVGPAAGGAAARAAAPAAEAAEHFLEDVLEGAAEGVAAAAAEAAGTAGAALFEGGVAEAVIGGALLGVLQDVVGLVQLLELGLGVLVALVAVGVPLHGELAIGLLQVLLAGVAGDAQHLVEVTLLHLCLPSDGGRRASARLAFAPATGALAATGGVGAVALRARGSRLGRDPKGAARVGRTASLRAARCRAGCGRPVGRGRAPGCRNPARAFRLTQCCRAGRAGHGAIRQGTPPGPVRNRAGVVMARAGPGVRTACACSGPLPRTRRRPPCRRRGAACRGRPRAGRACWPPAAPCTAPRPSSWRPGQDVRWRG